MKKVNDGNLEVKSGLIHRRGKPRNYVVDLPDVEFTELLKATEFGGHLRVMEGSEWGGEASSKPRPHKVLRRADKILHCMPILKGVPDPKDRGLLSAIVNIAAEDLEDPQALHGVKVRASKA